MATIGRVVDAVTSAVNEPDFPAELRGDLDSQLGAHGLLAHIQVLDDIERLPDSPAIWTTYGRWAVERFFDEATLPYDQWLLTPAKDLKTLCPKTA